MRILRSLLSQVLLGGSLAFFVCGKAGAVVLITESEAALPPVNTTVRGISRGPKIVVISPAPNAGTVQSPLNLRLKFESFGGSKIDVDSVVVTYQRSPLVDLTSRIMKFITPEGIEVLGAEVPPGTHKIRVEVKDTERRLGWADVTFGVSR